MTRAHFDAGSARVKAKGAAYLPRSQLAHVLDKKPAAAAPKKAAPKKKARVIASDSESEEDDDESDSEPESGSEDDDDDDDADEVMPRPKKRGAPRTRGDSGADKKPAARKKRR